MHLTDTHRQVREMARQFADDVVRPAAEALDRDERFPSEIYEQMGELGLFGIGVPEEMGGAGVVATSADGRTRRLDPHWRDEGSWYVLLPPGTYTIRGHKGELRGKEEVVLTSGEERRVVIAME